MVDFEVPVDVAAGHDAFGVADFEGAAEVGGDGAAAVGHADDVDAVGEDGLEDGVFAQAPGHGHRNGPEPGDLALFAGHGVAPDEGVVVDDHVDDVLRSGRGGVVGSEQVEQGVDAVGVAAFEPAAPDGVDHDGVGPPVDRVHQPGQRVCRHGDAQMADLVAVDPRPHPPVTVDPAIPVVLIDDHRRLDPAAFVPQPSE